MAINRPICASPRCHNGMRTGSTYAMVSASKASEKLALPTISRILWCQRVTGSRSMRAAISKVSTVPLVMRVPRPVFYLHAAYTISPRKVIAQQRAVARNAIVAVEQPQAGPYAHGIVAEHRFADLLLQPLDDAHAAPVAARHDDRVGLAAVGAQAEVISLLGIGAAELDAGDEADHLAVHHLEPARLHERHHGLVHGLAPRRANRDLVRAEMPQRVDARGGGGGRAPAGRLLDAGDQLAVVADALGERRRGRGEDDAVDLGVGELAALAFELEHAALLLLRRDVPIGDAAGVQRHLARQRGEEFRLLRRVGGGGEQAEALHLRRAAHRAAHCDPSSPAAWITGWNLSISDLMKRPKSSGVLLLTAGEPCVASVAFTSGMASTLTRPSCSLSTIGFGTPAGARMPLQPTTTTLG